MPRAVSLLLTLVVAVGGALVVPAARSASPDVVVSQVYAGGGNSGASFTNDFVELFNRGSSAMESTGWMSMSTPALWDTPAEGGGTTPRNTSSPLVSCGVGVPETKSDELASVSVQPSAPRIAADALSIAGAAPLPS